ncbi:UDP-N-acetylmuramoylalanine--D-glutamate ligase [human gut metagenome]|uniref:UDP-N-acetylmuramoylalanine--D-glutamate ligase n=1 Tax=human gut metagenome TaxID=408170 RepID=K1S694_9ZZZZ
MAAALAALAAGVSPIRIRSSIYDFAPVEHRLEPAGEIGGVAYINDSKATNVDSTWYALESMKRPVVWIAGGTDKGNDYEPLKRFAREKVHTLVCMGIDNRKLVESFTGIIPEIISTDSLDAAMQAARKASRPGDVVLLSPACASFDLFKNSKTGANCSNSGSPNTRNNKMEAEKRRRKRPAIRTQRVRLCRPTHPDRSPA